MDEKIKMMTLADAAKRASVHRGYMRRAIASGHLSAIRMQTSRGDFRLDVDDVDRWIKAGYPAGPATDDECADSGEGNAEGGAA